MATKIAINGFGRIGRNILRATIDDKDLQIVAVNDLTDAKTLAHLLKYDSVFGPFNGTVEVKGDDTLIVNGQEIKIIAERDPAKLPWKALGVEIALECTGIFTKREQAQLHLDAGAKKVIISAPAKEEDITICVGVNHELYDPSKHNIISNASCTTNCLSPFAKVLNDNFTIKRGIMTTVHAYTNDQKILDLPHSDLRRARAAAVSMIPTTTGAAKAVGLVLPELKGKLDGMAIRVPTPNVSLVDLIVELEKDVTAEEINDAFRKAANGPMKGILDISDDPCVSIDYKGNAHSSIIDAGLTKTMGGNMAQVISWYDNEWGFSNRMKDLSKYIASKGL